MNKLSRELLDAIEEFKPAHPLKREIDNWRRCGKRRPYFHKYYFKQPKIIELQTKRKRIEDDTHRRFVFRCMLEDGFTNEQTIKLNYKNKLENQRLKKKLAELGLKIYMVSITVHFPRLNKHGNFRDVYHNKVEIIF